MKSLIAIMVTAFSLFSAHVGETSPRCLAGMREVLIKGHFTGPLVCSRENASFLLAGRTTGGKFSVYDYRYRYSPAEGAVMHGGQKVVIFQGNKYIGQYALSPPPYTAVSVDGTHVILESIDTEERVSLDLTKEPPREVWVNGEMAVFFR